MAATAVAGTTSSHALMRCYGRLEGGVAGGDGSGAGGGSGSQLALVLELLAGWDAIGGPPSFSSVTRDVYDPETKVSEGSLPPLFAMDTSKIISQKSTEKTKRSTPLL